MKSIAIWEKTFFKLIFILLAFSAVHLHNYLNFRFDINSDENSFRYSEEQTTNRLTHSRLLFFQM